MRLVILQPFYLPYSGVMELVRLADAFLFYDDVQFVKQGWQQRNRIMTSNGPQWLTVPVRREHGALVNEVRIADDQRWQAKHWRALQMAYGSAPHGSKVLEALEPHYVAAEWEHLVDLNLATFDTLCRLCDVSAQFLRSSDLNVGGKGSDRVLSHCLALGATAYLSGPAGRAYLDEGSFKQAGVPLEYLSFSHPTYPQVHTSNFEPYMSVVDLLANVGSEASNILAGAGQAVPFDEWGSTNE